MSNLSELLPAGAGAKSAEFVASGTLGSGATVALKADGTVEAVASASAPAAIGSSVAFNSVDSNDMDITYSSANQKVIITYRDQDNNSYGTVVVGTVSGTSISFGSPVVYNSANSIDGAPVSDENTGKIVIFYRDQGNSERGTAKVGTISGTSISFGSAVVFNSGGASNYNSPVYDPDTQKVVNFYKDEPNSNYATAIVGTVSGTSISFGSEVVWQSGEAEFISATYDTSANKMVVAYRDNSNSNYGTAIVGTVSGTSISFGAKSVYNTGDSRYNAIAYDASSGSVVVVYQDFSNSSYGTAVVGTVSGTSISFGSEVVFDAYNPIDHISVADFAVGNVIVVSYERNDDSFYKVGTVSGNSITFDSRTNLVLAPAAQSIREGVTVYDNDQEKIVFAYQQSSTAGKGIVFNPAYTTSNNTDFIGITDEAIANTATGAVIVQGGVSEKASVAPVFSSGTPVVFEAATSVYIASAFDSTNNKVVIAYQDNGNSNYGTAIVGTVSGSTISFGTPVIFQSQVSSWVSATFDSSNSKVVIAYRRELSGSNRINSVVGTVSGTNITFGSIVTVTTNDGDYTSTVFDSNANKVVIAYRDLGNSSYGTAIVGTVSGTSISYGTPVVFEAATSYYISSAFDSNENKIVLSYRDGGNTDAGTSVVGTVSGSTISFGTPVAYSTDTSNSSTVFDSNNNKIVISYRHNGNANAGTAIVGTVSGTSISFGTPVVFDLADSQFVSATFDPNVNKVVVAYKDGGNSNYGTATIGSVNGTSITFSDYIVFEESIASNWITTTFDSNLNKVIVSYQDGANYLNYGTSAVITGDASLTPNTDYYVQADGSLSTTVSSAPAGRALSSTSILLEG